jgi:hypothetical protein
LWRGGSGRCDVSVETVEGRPTLLVVGVSASRKRSDGRRTVSFDGETPLQGSGRRTFDTEEAVGSRTPLVLLLLLGVAFVRSSSSCANTLLSAPPLSSLLLTRVEEAIGPLLLL